MPLDDSISSNSNNLNSLPLHDVLSFNVISVMPFSVARHHDQHNLAHLKFVESVIDVVEKRQSARVIR